MPANPCSSGEAHRSSARAQSDALIEAASLGVGLEPRVQLLGQHRLNLAFDVLNRVHGLYII